MKIIYLIFVLSYSTGIYCQDTLDYNKIKLVEPSDFEFAESSVLNAANHILSLPISVNDSQSTREKQFIFDWISRTPNFTFPFDRIHKITKDDGNLYLIYIACLAKFRIEHEENSATPNEVMFGSAKLFLEYCTNPNSKIKLTKRLRKLLEADKRGQLEKVL